MVKLLLIGSVVVCLLAVIVYKNSHFKSILNYLRNDESSKVFTSSELKQYNGIDKPKLYLAILGNVFDVSNGLRHYGPGETYNIFVGRDATQNFVTGKFNLKDISDEVSGFNNHELLSLNNWLKFYKREYKRVGKLIGRYYNENGKLTAYGKQIKLLIKKAEDTQDNEELLKRQFPPCNIEWDAEKGSRVWCTRRSGGIERSWVGVPRQLYEPGSDSYRCVCVNSEEKLGNIKDYFNCAPDSPSCFVQ